VGDHARPVVLFADLNNFKELNDRFGHREGDIVLRTLAEAIQPVIRNGDIAARLGGDEFVIAFDAPPEDGARLVARTRIAVDRALRRWPDVSVAVGAITVGPHDTPEEVLDRADLAMYRDKRSKRRAGPGPKRPSSRPPWDDLAARSGAPPQGAASHPIDVVLVVDALGIVQLASPSAREVLGFDPDDSVGMDGLGLVHPADLPRAVEAMAATLSSPMPSESQRLRVRDAAGTYRLVEISAVNRLDDPDIRGIVVTVGNISSPADRDPRVTDQPVPRQPAAGSASELVDTPPGRGGPPAGG